MNNQISNEFKKKVLIVEDNIESQLIFKIYLRNFYNVEVSDTGEEGLKLLEENHFDLVLLDVHLPGKFNGIDVLDRVRKTEKLKNLPVIIMTAYSMEDMKVDIREKGISDFLNKPIERGTLLNSVQKII